MCNSDQSSQIQKDPVHSKWTPYTGNHCGPAESRSDQDIANDLDKLEGLYHIQLAGGEPTINKTQIDWLTRLAESGKSKEIELYIVSNFTTTNRKIFNVITEFKNAIISLSLDGTDDVYNYIRWPGHWNSIEKNIEYIAPMRDKVALHMNTVVQAYNVFNIPTLLEWVRTHSINAKVSNVYQPFLDYRILSDEAQDKARNAVKCFAEKLGTTPTDVAMAAAIDDWLTKTQTRFTPAEKAMHLRTFIEFTNDLDHSRGQSLQQSVPEVYDDIVGMLGEWPSTTRHLAELEQRVPA